jgi:hypothetical protein
MQTLKNYQTKIVTLMLGLCLALIITAALPARSFAANPSPAPCSNSSNAGIQSCVKNNQIVKDINAIVNFLSAGVGIVVIGSLIVGGIQYSLAGDNATALQAAKKRITDAMIALIVFIFIFAFLQWLLPGGI